MLGRAEIGAGSVRHRIDDLEKQQSINLYASSVRHRIDDLEMTCA